MKIGIAVLAMVALAFIDYLVLAAVLLGRPTTAEYIIIGMVIGAVVAIILRQRWMLFAVQNVVTVVGIFGGSGGGDEARPIAVIAFIGLLLLGNVFAWLIARALPSASDMEPVERSQAS